jgi:hypothetical protein
MAFVTLGTVAPGDVLRANSGTAAYNNVIGNLAEFSPQFTAWTSWTPAVAQAGARTSTNTQSRYLKVGKLVNAYCAVTITQTGSAGNVIVCSLPVSPAFTASVLVGHFWYVRTTGIRYVGGAFWDNGSQSAFLQTNDVNSAVLGTGPNFATANGDLLRIQFTYEAA